MCVSHLSMAQGQKGHDFFTPGLKMVETVFFPFFSQFFCRALIFISLGYPGTNPKSLGLSAAVRE